ncbi:hypothetical protein JTB14_022973 [Gonioctena quinquepunctata]|nr:hypothetical protein JTB14_022973 [Gonioctena quinquepunctata]
MFTALSAHVKSTRNDWFLDSGCSAHLTVDKSNFISEEISSKLTITTANDQQMETNCVGDIQLPVRVSDQSFNVNVENVFYVPDLKVNLLSVSQIVQKGNKVNFNSEGAHIINAQGKTIATATLKNNLFKIDRPSENAMLTRSDMLGNALLWHKRMGHVNFPNLNKLKNGLVHGIQFHEKIPEGFVCEICATKSDDSSSEEPPIGEDQSDPDFILSRQTTSLPEQDLRRGDRIRRPPQTHNDYSIFEQEKNCIMLSENTESNHEKYICINCGKVVKSLYKKYSSTVLKLTECVFCRNVADKYVEYDAVIVIIDLILLRIMAYRHFLLNYEFKNYYKLFLVLLILETYSKWTITKKEVQTFGTNDTKPYLHETDIYLDDFRFYDMSLSLTFGIAGFIISTYLLTKVYTYLHGKDGISLLSVFKAITLSSCGMFLLLPSLIWDKSVHEFHMVFISLYTTLSQLIAHKAICDCEKKWSLIIIFSSYILKIYIIEFSSIIQLSSLLKIS